MRAFIAIDASAGAMTQLQNEIISTAGLDSRSIKGVDPQNFHFTIIFLGEKNDDEVNKIKDKLADVKFEPFMLRYTGIGAFPKPSSARVVWIGVDQEGGQKMVKLANEVVSRMTELGFSQDKPFSPHLTIFRVRDRPIQITDVISKYEGKVFGSDLVDKIHLKRSDLRPTGPIYSNVYTKQAEK